ncbi:MFS transporter [Neomicrococcus aestuarii]|uniref:MFS transporter n=1 Tax=Neomicrococcus aestuarii TaxID=556325 RepID=UPI0018DEBEED|nr:MFS transporter [Neomicrococcus aestuarii]
MMSTSAHRERLWTRGFLLACSGNALVFFTVHLFLSTVAAYSIQRFAVGDAQGGAASGLFIIGALIARLFAGPAMSRFSMLGLALGMFALFAIFPILYLMTGSFELLLAERFTHGVVFGIGSSVTASLALHRVPAMRMAEGTSWFASSTVIGVAAGPLVGLPLFRTFGFEAVSWAAVMVAVLGLVVIALLKLDGSPIAAQPAAPSDDSPKGNWISRFVEPAAIPISIIGAAWTLGYATIVTYLNGLANERDLGTGVSWFFLVYAVVTIASRQFTGRLMDRKGFNIVLIPAFVVFAAGLFTLSMAQNVATVLIAAALVGLGQGNLLSAGQTLAIKQAERHRIGFAVSTFFLGIDAGMGTGPVIAGAIVAATSPSATFGIVSLFVLALTAVYVAVFARKRQSARG